MPVRIRDGSHTLHVQAESSHQYYTYYLSGLDQALGGTRLRFGTSGFPSLRSPRDGMSIITETRRRIFLAADDGTEINLDALAWCDIYAKINLLPSDEKNFGGGKLVALGPGFGIRWGKRTAALALSMKASFAGGGRFASPAARLRAADRHWRSRSSLGAYEPGHSDPTYLFMVATYWTNHVPDNEERIVALNAARGISGLQFEGGLVPNGVCDLATALRAAAYSHDQYLTNLKRSVAAINTAAVHGCLGWKLGEFFALGKAIITTPIQHAMPGDYSPGRHAHEVDGSEESWREAIDLVRNDDRYRAMLEANARKYFEDWIAPVSAAARLL